jgi:hypothetical protein
VPAYRENPSQRLQYQLFAAFSGKENIGRNKNLFDFSLLADKVRRSWWRVFNIIGGCAVREQWAIDVRF